MRFFRVVFFSGCLSAVCSGADYFVDSATGDDAAAGTGETRAWRSLEKVNSAVFHPGDRLLFKSGGEWIGQLKPKGSGQDGRPILLGRYGEGPKPRIEGKGMQRDALLLENIEFWEVADLEITNKGPETAPFRTDVRISSDGFGKMRHIYLRRLHVRDVNGDLRKSHEGCGIYFEASGGKASHFDGLLIEDCHVSARIGTGFASAASGGNGA